MNIEFSQLLAELKKKIYHPVYFLTGEEPYFIDRISDFIEKNVLDQNEKEFNQTVLYGGDTDTLSLIAAAKRFPMMSTHQVIIVKEAQNIRDLAGKASFLSYLEKPLKSTILVLCYKYKSIDKRTQLGKNLVKYAAVMESKKLYENKIPDWINACLKEKKYSISPKACLLLTEFLGTDLSRIGNELDKLTIGLPQQSEITEEHIQQNIGISKEFNSFELQSALGRKDVVKANRIVNYFAANQKENPMVLTLSSLYGFFSKLLTYQLLPDKSKTAVAGALGINPYFVGDYERAAKLYPGTKLKTVIADLREYDLRSKGLDGTATSGGELLKELVFKIIH